MISISFYQFIASEHPLPDLLSPKLHYPDGRDRSSFESPDDLEDLEIIQEMIGYLFVDISVYTKKKLIYRLNMTYTPERGQRLYDYLKAQCQPDSRYELWTIDMNADTQEAIHNQLVHLHRTYCTKDVLSLELLARECDHQTFTEDDYPRVLIIQPEAAE